jgi:hypothetical protein
MEEYCDGFGIAFNSDNFEAKLMEMLKKYDEYVYKMKDFPNTSELMSKNYYQLFLNLYNKRNEIVNKRKLSRYFLWLAENL